MPSFKRRRAINVDVSYIEALKKVSQYRFQGKKSATAVASLIFDGGLPPLPTVKMCGKAKGVSMTEAMWLSIRRRSEIIGKAVSATTQLLLSGEESKLTQKEISFGLERAKEREERRASGNPEEPSPPKPAETQPELPAPEPEQARPEPKETVTADVEVPVVDAIETAPEPAAPPQEPEPDSTDAVKQTHDEEAEERNRRQMKLSKGHPADLKTNESRVEKKLKPGLVSYGGVFSI